MNDKKNVKEELDSMPQYLPVELRSTFLLNMICKIDNHIAEQEELIREQNDTIKDLQEKMSDRLNQDLVNSQKMMANVLSACISTPSVNSLGPVGATVIAKIRDMEKIDEVKGYIEEIIKDNEKELKVLDK